MSKSFSKIKHIQESNIKAERRMLNEGFRMDLNPQDIILRLNQIPNKTAQVIVEGQDLVFIINNQKFGLDCSAPSQGSPVK